MYAYIHLLYIIYVYIMMCVWLMNNTTVKNQIKKHAIKYTDKIKTKTKQETKKQTSKKKKIMK